MSNTLLLDNALATMGAGLPSAMMAALLYPGRRVLAVCGDGGFMMNSQELETAVRLGLNLVVLILQDDAYGMIRWKQAVDEFADFGLTFGNPDFVRYAEAYGAQGTRVESTEELVPVLQAAFERGGVQLVVGPGRLLREHPRPRRRAPQPGSRRRGGRRRNENQGRGAGRHGCGVAVRGVEAAAIEEIELDPPGPGEVLVRIEAAGLCHSDLSVINGNRPRPTADGAGP